VERTQVTHNLSTQFARIGRTGVARDRHDVEPASRCCLGIMACAVHEDDACEMRATQMFARIRQLVAVATSASHPLAMMSEIFGTSAE
jgi:hypothetical protein